MTRASWNVFSNYKYSTLASLRLAETDAVAAAVYNFAWSGTAGDNEVKGGERGTCVFSLGRVAQGDQRRFAAWIACSFSSNSAACASCASADARLRS